MTYFQFHLMFNLPALVVLLILARRRLTATHWKWISLICVGVFVLVTPWDNWAVYRGIWTFDWERVTPVVIRAFGIDWKLPAEEYAFFLVETILVSLVTVLFLSPQKRAMKWTYFAHLMIWATPCIVLQWLVGWRIFRRNARAVFFPALIGGSFFSLTDSIAVRSGIWVFDAGKILGLHIGPLPVEEVLFFFLTSLLVSQSLVLFLPASMRR